MGKEEMDHKGPRKTNVRGDQNIMLGKISSGGISFQGGRENVISIHQYTGPDVKELTAVFEKLYQHIESRPPDSNVDKEEIVETVQKIEQETSKGEQANETKLTRWMENLNKLAPDVIDVALASLGGPVSGVTAVLKKIADRARQAPKV